MRLSFVQPHRISLVLILIFISFGKTPAQTTGFTYQGKLTDGGALASGQYDFQFRLYDTANPGTGSQFGSVLSIPAVQVSSGIFSVQLDFGTCPTCFNGSVRFLEIAVKFSGGPSFTTLTPRQQITSTPYAARSLNATNADGLSIACVNCVTSNQIQSIQGSQISGAIPVASVPTGSTNYIQNTASQQASSNFNISGNGTAGGTLTGLIVNAGTQYNLSGVRVLSVAGSNNLFAGVTAGQNNTGSGNTFVGSGAGVFNTEGNANSFFGASAGINNTLGGGNSFFGLHAGFANTSGGLNSFVGLNAGLMNTAGNRNSFFGVSAGEKNLTAQGNTFVGTEAGYSNTTGQYNTFVGDQAGYNNSTASFNNFIGNYAGASNHTGFGNNFFGVSAGAANDSGQLNSFFGFGAGFSNTSGSLNSFFGENAGQANTTGFGNTALGEFADFGSGSLNNATAIGSGAFVTQSNSLVLGSINGINNAQSSTNVGIGTTNPAQRLHVVGRTLITDGASSTGRGILNLLSAVNADLYLEGQNAGRGINLGVAGTSPNATLFISQYDGSIYRDRLVVTPTGTVKINILGSAGATALCRNDSTFEISTCSSSLRYKENVSDFNSGLELINGLRPVSFRWKSNRQPDLGLIAEEVAAIEPLLATYNEQGDVEGVKYDRIAVVLLNAVKQQQAEIDALKKLACADHPDASVCKKERHTPGH